MREVVKKLIIIVVLVLIDILSLILISIFDANHTTGVIWIVCSVIVVFIMIFLIRPKDLMEFELLQTKRLRTKRYNEIKYLRLPHNEFKGVTKTYSRNRPLYPILLMILFASMAVFFLFDPAKDIKGILIMSGSFLLLLYQLFLLFFETVTITPEFIRCRHWLKDYTIRWNEIKTVGITVTHYGRPQTILGYIYVSKQILTEDIVDVGKGSINDNFLILAYSTKAVLHIMANYHGHIKNLSIVGSWIRYLKKNQ